MDHFQSGGSAPAVQRRQTSTLGQFLAMGGGAVFFWLLGRVLKDPERKGYKVFVENRETVSAGIIAGGALIGIILIVLKTVLK